MALTTRGANISEISDEGTALNVEYEPVSIGENTEVKVPVSPKANRTGTVPINYLDTSDDFLTPGQRILSDCEEQNSFNNDNNSNENDDDDVMQDHLAEFNKLSTLVKELPGELFVNRILLDYSQCDVNLERTRAMLFDIVREAEDFPYDRDVDLKRRLTTKSGDSVAVKLANDIHKLLVVIEGADYSELRDMISTGTIRGRQRGRLTSFTRSSSCTGTPSSSNPFGTSEKQPTRGGYGNSTVNLGEQTASDECKVHLKQLNSEVSDLKAEILLMKQRQIAIENSRSDQIKSLKTAVTSINSELNSMVDTLKANTSEINKTLNCMKSEHADNIETLKNKILENGKSLIEVQEQCINAIGAQRAALNMISDSNTLQKASRLPVSNDVEMPVMQTSSFSERLSATLEKQTHVLHVNPTEDSDPMSGAVGAGSPVFTAERMIGQNHIQNTDLIDDWAKHIGTVFSNEPGPGELASTIADVETELSFGNMPIPENHHVSARNSYTDIVQGTTKRKICFADIIADIGTPSSPKVSLKRRSLDDQPISVRITGRNTSSKTRLDDKPKSALTVISTDDAADDEFETFVRRRTKRYYVGGFLPTITESKIESYVTRRGLTVSKVAVFRNKQRKTTVIRLNMVNDSVSRRVLEPGFWPKGVTCRPWLSFSAYRRNNQNTTNTQRSSAIYDRGNKRSENLLTISGSWGNNQCSSWGSDWSDYNPFSALD